MNISTPVTKLFFALIIFSLVFAGCKKELSQSLTEQEEKEAAMEASVSETETEIAFNDVFDNVVGVNGELGIAGVGIFGKVMMNGRENRVDTIRCFTHTITPVQPGVFPKTVTIDFGTGCQSHGHVRSGKIVTVYTGPLTQPGNSATTTFVDYKIDGMAVQGTHKVTNTTASTPGSNKRQFTIDVTAAKLTRPNGDYIEWNSHRVNTQVEGNGTIFHQDDIFSITGGARGNVKKGNNIYRWNSEIIEPLIKKFTCRWISKGILRVARETLPTNSPWISTLNYGQGGCDNQATLTINGVVHQITLH